MRDTILRVGLVCPSLLAKLSKSFYEGSRASGAGGEAALETPGIRTEFTVRQSAKGRRWRRGNGWISALQRRRRPSFLQRAAFSLRGFVRNYIAR